MSDPAIEAALRLRAGGPWVEHVEHELAMKRERDGECICNRGPDIEGPDEFCPWHGRRYSELVEIIVQQQAQINVGPLDEYRGLVMSDIVERAATMITTIGYAKFHRITQAYPDSTVAGMLKELIAEVERLQPGIITERAELDSLANGSAVLDDMGDVLKRDNYGWMMAGFAGRHLPILPARLLFHPRQEAPHARP